MSNTVVWFDSAEVGAPTLNNVAGSLDAVLNACLVTGFRVLTLDSISVAAGVATATYAAGHQYSTQRVLEIAGAATGAINGRKLITVTGAGTFTFPAPGVADTPSVGGSIQAKRAPLGWARPLSSGNVSIYERTDVTATAMKLRIDDTGTGLATSTSARARMVETVGGDVNTFTGPAPTDAQASGGFHWLKGANTAAEKPWVLVGDSKTFYLFLDGSSFPSGSYLGMAQGIFGFGDITSYRAGDAYACFLAGSSSSTQIGSTGFGYLESLGATPSGRTYLPRPYNSIGGPVSAAPLGVSSARRLGGGGPTYPSPVNNGLIIGTPVYCAESLTAFQSPLRGEFRGIGDPLATIPGGALHLQRLPNLGGSGRDWLLVGFQQDGGYGHAAFDITGPWA